MSEQTLEAGPLPQRMTTPLAVAALLALAEEQRPLHACLGGLNRLAPL